MKTCPMCKGSKKGNPTSSGSHSSWDINKWLMKQPCGYCKGSGEVPDDDQPTQKQIDLYTKITKL